MSRDLNDLDPRVREAAQKMIDKLKDQGIEILVTCTYRSPEEQDALYAQGRTKPGPKVTNARAGQSAHQYRLAFDVVPMRNGKPVWGTSAASDMAIWQEVGKAGEYFGLEWAGRWVSFKEYPHFQWLGGLTIEQLQAGQRP